MTNTLIQNMTGLRTLAILSGLMLGSCQTSAEDILSGDVGIAVAAPEASSKPGYSDPRVVAVSGQAPDAAANPLLAEAAPASLKRKPVPLAAAYSDIAEPPPEVLALQQHAAAGDQTARDAQSVVMQPTEVNAGENSLFSPGRTQTQTLPAEDQTQTVPSAQPKASLVPSNMPALGVNAMSKSLFSPSTDVQAMPVSTEQTDAVAAPAVIPTVEPDTGPPVLHKLSDPRPKRKILALREPSAPMPAAVPARVELTPAQMEAMGAVAEPAVEAAEGADGSAADPSEPAPKKKKWLPSLAELLSGGEKAKAKMP